MKYFITYGDEKFTLAKKIIINEAEETGEFDEVISYGRNDLSNELLSSIIINVPRGGGLWSWKPDVILTTINKAQDGDLIVYCDSGCTIQKSPEWNRIWRIMKDHDLLAQRLYQRTDMWTRKELIEHFSENGSKWLKCYQYLATVVIVKVSVFSRQFIKEWRDMMIMEPLLAMDVTPEERQYEHPELIENRHDQAIYSSLIYKYRKDKITQPHIYTQWEHIENYDIFCKQAIRATRLRQGEKESFKKKFNSIYKRIIKDLYVKPFCRMPKQWYYGKDY